MNSILTIVYIALLLNIDQILATNPVCKYQVTCSNLKPVECAQTQEGLLGASSNITIYSNICSNTTRCDLFTGACVNITGPPIFPVKVGNKALHKALCKSQYIDTMGLCIGIDEGNPCKGIDDCIAGDGCKYVNGELTCSPLIKIMNSCTNIDYMCDFPLDCSLGYCKNPKIRPFQKYFKICIDGDTSFCVSNGTLSKNVTSFSEKCKYVDSNGKNYLVEPDCLFDGTPICNYGLGNLINVENNFYDYLNNTPLCTKAMPFCMLGKGTGNPLSFILIRDQLFELFRIKERVNSVLNCYYDWNLILRYGQFNLNYTVNRLLASLTSTTVIDYSLIQSYDFIVDLMDIYIAENNINISMPGMVSGLFGYQMSSLIVNLIIIIALILA